MYRLFVAVDLPEKVKESIKDICSGLMDARWVDIQQLHLTLRFIGEVDERQFKAIMTSLADISESPFYLTLQSVGCFPPKRPPRVLWVGIERSDSLMSLAEKTEQVLVEKNGIEPENRKFSPHITIARFRESSPAKVADYLARNSSFRTETFLVDSFYLYSSTITSAGAIHRREASYFLE